MPLWIHFRPNSRAVCSCEAGRGASWEGSLILSAVDMQFKIRAAAKEDCKEISRMIMVSLCQVATADAMLTFVVMQQTRG